MSLLDDPLAQALLADAEVSAVQVAGCRRCLESFVKRYLPRFYRVEQHELARVVLQGKLSNLERKTSEPIAYQAGLQRKPVQHFVGSSVVRCKIQGIRGGFRAGRYFLWLTAGKSAGWSRRSEERVAKDGYGQHHHRHRSA
jgi:hypothetical protein